MSQQHQILFDRTFNTLTEGDKKTTNEVTKFVAHSGSNNQTVPQETATLIKNPDIEQKKRFYCSKKRKILIGIGGFVFCLTCISLIVVGIGILNGWFDSKQLQFTTLLPSLNENNIKNNGIDTPNIKHCLICILQTVPPIYPTIAIPKINLTTKPYNYNTQPQTLNHITTIIHTSIQKSNSEISLFTIKKSIQNKINKLQIEIFKGPSSLTNDAPNVLILDINNYERCKFNTYKFCWNPIYINLEGFIIQNSHILINNFLIDCLAFEVECPISNLNGKCYKQRCLKFKAPQDLFLFYLKNKAFDFIYIDFDEVFILINKTNIHGEIIPQQLLNNVVSNINTYKSVLLFIDLNEQTKCSFNNNLQCWKGTLINNFQKQNIFIPVTLLMKNCLAIKVECPSYSTSLQCFKRICLHKEQLHNIVIYYNNNQIIKQSSTVDIIFELNYGNFHSSWQNDVFNSLDLEQHNAMENVQNIIKDVNFFSKIPFNELHLSYTLIEKCNCGGTSTWYSFLKKEKTHYNIESKIKIDINHRTQDLFLHERVHEFINSRTLADFTFKSLNDLIYNGVKTVNMAITDFNNRLFQHELFQAIKINNTQYGLLLQDNGHLGNWGKESSPSNYYQVNSFLGKYTLSVMKEIGFEIINSTKKNDFISILSNYKFTKPFCKLTVVDHSQIYS